MERWYKLAHMFTLRQRINELEKALKRSPDSPNFDARAQELNDKRTELARLEENR